jgi:hypothetical protein
VAVYLVPILPNYSQKLKLELLKMLGFVLANIEELWLDEDGRLKLCRFLYATFESIASSTTIFTKYEFACATVSVLRILLAKPAVSEKKQKLPESYSGKSLVNCRALLRAFITKI